ncbi:MAG TPA: hypothetical protein VF844_17780 [Ktedonobacteraceae bacterium]
MLLTFVMIALKSEYCPEEWIRIPSIIYASVLLTVVLVILGEEIGGTHATPQLPIVLLANLPWLLFPIYTIYRMWRYPEPFTLPVRPTETLVSQGLSEHTGMPRGV